MENLLTQTPLGHKLEKFCECIAKVSKDNEDRFHLKGDFGEASLATSSRFFLKTLLEKSPVVEFLIYLSRSTVSSIESESRCSPPGITESKASAHEETLLTDEALACCERLKYCFNTNLGDIIRDIALLGNICNSAQQVSQKRTDFHDSTSLTCDNNNKIPTVATDLVCLAQLHKHADAFCECAIASVLFKDYLIAMAKLSEGIRAVEGKLASHATALAELAIGYAQRAVDPEMKRLLTIMKPSTKLAQHLDISTEQNVAALNDEITKLTAEDWAMDVHEIADALTLCTMGEVIASTTVGATLRKKMSSQIHFFDTTSLRAYTNSLIDLQTAKPRTVHPVSTCRVYGDFNAISSDSRTVDIIVANIDKLI